MITIANAATYSTKGEMAYAMIQTKLDMASKTHEERAQELFREVFAMLDYAMVVGHLEPGEFSNWRRLVDMQKLRRQYQ